MNTAKIDKAILEAHRFLRAVEAARRRLEADRMADFGCKETAACRRASMDLTRALAELRKP